MVFFFVGSEELGVRQHLEVTTDCGGFSHATVCLPGTIRESTWATFSVHTTKSHPSASGAFLDRQSMIQVWGDVFCWSAEDTCQVTAAFNRLKWLLLDRKYCWTLGLCTRRCLSESWRCCIGQSCGYKHNDAFKTLKTLFSTELLFFFVFFYLQKSFTKTAHQQELQTTV